MCLIPRLFIFIIPLVSKCSDFTQTKGGERLLFSRVLNPITDKTELERRYNNIDSLLYNYNYKKFGVGTTHV